MFIQEKPFWIAAVKTDGVVVKKTTAEELNAFIKRARQFSPYREGEKRKLVAFYGLSLESKDLHATKRIINRGTDGRVGWRSSEYGSIIGGYAVSFTSNKAARLVAEKLQAELDAKKAEEEAKALEKKVKKAKFTEKHLNSNRKVWVASFIMGRYGDSDRFEEQVTIGRLAELERAQILDDDEVFGDTPMQIDDLMSAIVFDKTSPLKKALKVKSGKAVGIMTEEGYHAISGSKAAAIKRRDKQLMTEALQGW